MRTKYDTCKHVINQNDFTILPTAQFEKMFTKSNIFVFENWVGGQLASIRPTTNPALWFSASIVPIIVKSIGYFALTIVLKRPFHPSTWLLVLAKPSIVFSNLFEISIENCGSDRAFFCFIGSPM